MAEATKEAGKKSIDRVIRVFVSSTFRDMHAERDHLVTVVFPELRERCERLGLEFFDVDLRWGVPAKDANGETANSWEYCRQWIDRVEPFFVCILGQRYGWVPEPEQLKSKEDGHRQQVEKRSITDMEIRHAVLNTRLNRRSYFYLRATEAPTTASEYVDPPPLLSKLEQLKKEVRACGRPVRDYPCQWTGSGFTGMEEFGHRVLDDLWSGVLRDERYVSKKVWREALASEPDRDPRYTDESISVSDDITTKIVALAKPPPQDPLDAEREQMQAFAASRLRWFQGRTHELRQLADFLYSTAADSPRLAVLVAVPGQGKSALLAHLYEQLKSSPHFLIAHFVGATERSGSTHALVERLLGELDHSGITLPAGEQEGQEPKLDFNSLCLRLAQRLGDYAGERRIVILLDALNQLSDGHDLCWLPTRIGPSVRVIVSCIADAAVKPDSPEQRVLHALTARKPAPLRVPLGPLTEEDVRAIVVAYLKEYCHELDGEHLEKFRAITQAHNPLYLLVMLNELRTLGGNDLNSIVPALIASMPQNHPDTASLFRWVLERLEVFGQDAVRWWCSYLAYGRVGMASHELADLLARKLGADAAATALRIERGLRRYLQRRGPQLDFFHGQLRQAVLEQHGPQAESTTIHSDIAAYFRDLADPEKNQSWKGDNSRPFGELPFHLVHAQIWPKLVSTLEDISFLEAKVGHGMVFDLARDFSRAVKHLPSDHPQRRILRLLEEALRRAIHIIARHAKGCSQALFQCLWNSCWWYDAPEAMQWLEAGNDTGPTGGHPQAVPASGVLLWQLTERWCTEKNRARSGGSILRSLLPPRERIGSPLITSFVGHQGIVHAACFSPNGERVATVSIFEGTVRIWNAQTGLELGLLRGPEQNIICAAWSPDGRLLASGSNDGVVRVWNTETFQQVAELRNDAAVTALGFATETTLILGGQKDRIRVANLVTGRYEHEAVGHAKAVLSLVRVRDGGHVFSSGYDGFVRVWGLRPFRLLREIALEGVVCAWLSLFTDGRRLGLCEGLGKGEDWRMDWRITVRDATTGRLLQVAATGDEEDASNCVAVSPDQRWLAFNHGRGVRVFELASGNVSSFPGQANTVSTVAFAPNRPHLLSCGGSSAMLWDLAEADTQEPELRFRYPTSIATPSPDGRRIATVPAAWNQSTIRETFKILLWDATGPRLREVLEGHSGTVDLIRWSGDGRRVVSTGWDAEVWIWDVEERSSVAVKLDAVAQSLVLSPNDRYAACACRDGSVQVIDLASGQRVKSLRMQQPLPNRERIQMYMPVAFAPEGNALACAMDPAQSEHRPGEATDTSIIYVWDLPSGNLRHVLSGHTAHATALAFGPEGQRLASGTMDASVRVWDMTTGRPIHVLTGHTGMIESLCFTRGGKHLVSGQVILTQPATRLWNLETGACLRTWDGFFDVRAMASVCDPNVSFKETLVGCYRGSEFLVIALPREEVVAAIATEYGAKLVWNSASRTVAGSDGQHLYLYCLQSRDC